MINIGQSKKNRKYKSTRQNNDLTKYAAHKMTTHYIKMFIH